MSRLRTLDKVVLATLFVAGVPTVLPVLDATPVAAAPVPSGSTYTIKNGDYLAGIAAKLKVRLADLLTANSLQLTSLIHPGQVLVVPAAGAAGASTRQAGGTSPGAGSGSAGAYTVKSGDSLAAIAGKVKVRLADLLAANGLTLASVIHPGQQLQVPAGGTAPGTTAAANPASGTAPSAAYTVVPGDYLFGIAAKMNVRLAALLQANGLTPTSLILPGRQLTIPPGGTVPAAATLAATTATTSAAYSNAGAAGTGSRVDTILGYALAQVGKPYRYFAAGPDAFDCSGLVVAAFAAAGMGIVHQSAAQSQLGSAVDWLNEDIRRGDLVFTARSGGDPAIVGHVGIALSATQWVNAPRPGGGVQVGSIPPDSRILAVRRVL
jgi:LysM repeat protein